MRFMLSHPAHCVALGGGIGLLPKAPGTFGSLLGLPAAWFCLSLDPLAALGLVAAAFLLGVWACGRTGHDLGVADHGGMVWDEVVAMWAVLLLVPATLLWWGMSFATFRLFDIWKPFPIGWLDRKVKGGFGVMLDDALAAVYAVMTIHLLMQISSAAQR